MYRDLKNLTIIQEGDAGARAFIGKNNHQPKELQYEELKIIGYENLKRSSGIPLDMQFYMLSGIPFSKKWDSFFIERDLQRESKFFRKYIKENNYAFVHEDIPRGYVIDKSHIGKTCTPFIAENGLTDKISDYCTIIENANEIHVIDSSFMFLIDCLPYHNPTQKLFVHRYARANDEWQLPILRKDWTIITKYNNLQPKTTEEYPIKKFLTELAGVRNTITNRIIRKVFKLFKWGELKLQHPDIEALIRRYVHKKSFLLLTPNKKDSKYLHAAKEVDARIIKHSTLDTKEKAQIILCENPIATDTNKKELIRKIFLLTQEYLIYYGKNSNFRNAERLLIEAGFEIREKHIFPYEHCFIAKVTTKK